MQSKIVAVSGMISMMGDGVGRGTPDWISNWDIPPLPLIFFCYQLTYAFSVQVFSISRLTLTARSFWKQGIYHTGRVSSTFDIFWAALGVCYESKKHKQVNILVNQINRCQHFTSFFGLNIQLVKEKILFSSHLCTARHFQHRIHHSNTFQRRIFLYQHGNHRLWCRTLVALYNSNI